MKGFVMTNEMMKQIEIMLFGSCLKTSLISILLFTFLSFIPCALKVKHANVIIKNQNIFAMKDTTYLWCLLISVIVSLPPLFERILDAIKFGSTCINQNTLELKTIVTRTLEVIAVIIPNSILLIILRCASTDDEFSMASKIQDCIFYAQTLTIIGSIFCSMFGHKYSNKLDGKYDFRISVDRRTVCFLITFVLFRFFLSIALVVMDPMSKIILLLISSIFLVFGMVQMVYVASKILIFLWNQMIGFSFREYVQMHDFYRTIAVVCYSCYVFGWYVHSNRMLSYRGLSQQSSDTLCAYAIGQVLMIIFITLVDSRSYMRAAEIKGEQLQVRLNLIRYISHEMRSPLNTAFMGLQLLHNDTMLVLDSVRRAVSTLTLEDEPSEKSESLLQSLSEDLQRVQGLLETGELVKESSSLALETLNDMLTFDKMDEKKLVVEVEDVDVWAFVRDTVRPFSINALRAQVRLEVKCEDLQSRWVEGWRIRADRFKLNQVLRNFVSNALKFCRSPRGEVEVSVERYYVAGGRLVRPPGSEGPQVVQDFVRVSVVDNGAGISQENQRRLFGQYVQFDAGALQKGGGSGLGLWISKSEWPRV